MFRKYKNLSIIIEVKNKKYLIRIARIKDIKIKNRKGK